MINVVVTLLFAVLILAIILIKGKNAKNPMARKIATKLTNAIFGEESIERLEKRATELENMVKDAESKQKVKDRIKTAKDSLDKLSK